jgi:drug/metabolite transporter (DMT)-like permease
MGDRLTAVGGIIVGILFILGGMFLYALPSIMGRPAGYEFEAAREWGAPAFILIGGAVLVMSILLVVASRSRFRKTESAPPPARESAPQSEECKLQHRKF